MQEQGRSELSGSETADGSPPGSDSRGDARALVLGTTLGMAIAYGIALPVGLALQSVIPMDDVANSVLIGVLIGASLGVVQWLTLGRGLPIGLPFMIAGIVGWGLTFPSWWLFPRAANAAEETIFQAIQGGGAGLIIAVLQVGLARRAMPFPSRYVAAYIFGVVIARTVSSILNGVGLYGFLVEAVGTVYASVIPGSILTGALLGIIVGIVSAEQLHPRSAAESPSVGPEPARRRARFFNYLVDWTLISGIASGLQIYFEMGTFTQSRYPSPAATLIDSCVPLLVMLAYYAVFETVLGQTPGKLITGTVAVLSDGGRLTVGAVLLRTVLRLIHIEALAAIRWQPWHDTLSNTRVVFRRELRQTTSPDTQTA